MKMQMTHILKLVAALAFVTACTKSRQAELPEDTKNDVFAIADFGDTSDQSSFVANIQASSFTPDSSKSMKALDTTAAAATLSSEDVSVPERLKFMFDSLPLTGKPTSQVKITFTVDKDYVTAYKVVSNPDDLTPLEKSIAITVKEAQLVGQAAKAASAEFKGLSVSQKNAALERNSIKMGSAKGSLLVPMFKYKIDGYGTLERNKNELKENTAVLGLKKTDFKNATHVKISSNADSRLIVGLNADQAKQMNQLFVESKIDNQVTTAADLESRLNVGLKFLDPKARVYTKLDADVMHVYQIMKTSELSETKLRLLKNKAGNQEVMACNDKAVAQYINSNDKDCVIVLKADLPVNYKTSNLALVDLQGNTSNAIQFENVPRSKSVGLVEILENTAAKQVDISGVLDPDSSVRIADLKGEFYYRRTFEDASNMFTGETGTSGDMSIIRFELEDKRLVVRNQQSLITYTGQGPKDREEIMSFPVKYISMTRTSANGATLAIPVAEASSKEKAEYAVIDWTQNTVPNASSPLSFYAGGDCFLASSSQRVANTDMRLATDGILNFSLSGSYTMKPECATYKDVNAMYWAGMLQFNFNISERISFKKRLNLDSDKQFSMNISGSAQAAFNFGVFTLADKVTDNGTLMNRDGSEKYMPMIHDFRNGKKIKYYIGGLNNATATSPERRQLLIEATTQVVKEWNTTLRYAFRGTSLERAGDYIEMQVDEGENIGHLGDLDRNYIWFQELPSENGLLGVAQPAPNPRSGVIESSNVIIYSGNSYQEIEHLLANTKISRRYEKEKEKALEKAIAEAKETKAASTLAASKEATQKADEAKSTLSATELKSAAKLETKINAANKVLQQNIKYLGLSNPKMLSYVNGSKIKSKATKTSMTVGSPREALKARVNKKTFASKLAELATSKKLATNSHALELAVTALFNEYGDVDVATKAILQKRVQSLAFASRFDNSNKNRPGCHAYQRSEINDEVLSLDPDEHKNLLLNFKVTIMGALSHELGHAFGLLHNFEASMDKENYEFPEDKQKPTGRNYSSIMDYMGTTDRHYAGPGPYDAHALRAAYTGMVQLPDDTKNNELAMKVKVGKNNLVSMADIAKVTGTTSFVHLTKDSLNSKGLIKFYKQCDDGGLSEKATCTQFDVGSTAEDTVKNMIEDYNRGYILNNYAADRINFGWANKIGLIYRNISLYQSIYSYLSEAMSASYAGVGRPEAESKVATNDLTAAARAGYKFFHEVIHTPSLSEGANNIKDRLQAIPYEYYGDKEFKSDATTCIKDDKGLFNCEGLKVIEYRSLNDIMKNRDKMDTIGVNFDKYLALQFLVAPTIAKHANGKATLTSYFQLERLYMPGDSLIMQLLTDILSEKLRGGFFAATETVNSPKLIGISKSLEISPLLKESAVEAATFGLYQVTPNTGFDPLKDEFKVGRSYSASAPKDRLSVARLGQDRKMSDTRVFYAGQGASGVEPLILAASRNESFLLKTEAIHAHLAEISTADNAYRKVIVAMVAKACAEQNGKVADEMTCALSATKTSADYAKEIPEVAKLKAVADQKAAKLVSYLREQNKNGELIAVELDSEKSADNFARQVEALRQVMIINFEAFDRFVKAQLPETTTAESAQKLIQGILPTLLEVSRSNSTLAENNLGAVTLNFIQNAATKMVIKTSDGSALNAGVLADVIIDDADAILTKQMTLVQTISDISDYSAMIDPDTNSVR